MADENELLAAALKRIPFRDGPSHTARFELNDEQRSALHQVMSHPGYPVLLNLIEGMCVDQEYRQVNLPVETSVEIVGSYQRTTKAFWLLFTRFQKKARQEIAELFKVEEPETTEDDRLLDPTK